jgi:hypothetical protein
VGNQDQGVKQKFDIGRSTTEQSQSDLGTDSQVSNQSLRASLQCSQEKHFGTATIRFVIRVQSVRLVWLSIAFGLESRSACEVGFE